jgi:exo-beta-1,3-glucanase (GH17 family)
MHLPLGLFGVVAAVVFGVWSWLGAPVAMPPSPIAGGAKLYCVSYAPFRDRQSPLGTPTQIPASQIDDDLARLARTTSCVRTYSTSEGLDQVPALAAKHGLQVMQGIWLSSNTRRNRQEIERGIALAKEHPQVIRSLVVGNEVLLRGEMAVGDVVAAIGEVKAGVTVPVTYADVWEFWLRYRDLYPAVDFITIHILPYWEDFPIAAEHAGAHVSSIRARVANVFPDKEILIGETGWPSAGRMREAARPSPANQARVLHDVLAVAQRGGYRVNLIEAFDQPWKRALEGTVGGHWGLYDGSSRMAKFEWGAPVSNHPQWLLQAAAGVVLAGIVFLAAWRAGGASFAAGVRPWIAVAAIAAVAGTLIGLTAEAVLLESLGIGGWLRSLALAAVALFAPPIVAAAVMRRTPPPSFAVLFGGHAAAGADTLMLATTALIAATGALAIQSALGLVFDPRYKDFPNAALTAAAASFLVLLFAAPRGKLEFGVAERLLAALLGVSAIYIAFNESFANWQALWFAAVLLALTANLLRLAGVRKRG